MARITVEDCIDKFESRFELVLVASNRARKIHSGESPTVEKDNDKPTVLALREIAEESLSIDSLKDKLVQEYQTVSPLDEEELSVDFSDSENDIKDEIIEDQSYSKEEDDVDKNLSENELNEDEGEGEGEGDTILTSKNDDFTEILDDNKQN